MTGDDFHYLARVLRLQPGALINARDPDGNRYSLKLEERARQQLQFRVMTKEPAPASGRYDIELLVGLPKLQKMDVIVRTAAELGVDRLRPLVTEFSAVGVKDIGRLDERMNRWRKIARSGLEQSGRSRPLEIEPIAPLQRLLQAEAAGETTLKAVPNGGRLLSLVAWEKADGQETLHELLGHGLFTQIRLLVGPEGGFSSAEVESLTARGFAPVRLGEHILRTETAVVAFCAAVNVLLMEKEIWNAR